MILRASLPRPRPTAVWGSEAARDLLEHNGLADVESVFERARPERLRHAGRAVVEQTLVGTDGGETRAFVKLSFGPRRWWPRMTDLKTGQAWRSLPALEWQGIATLAALGLCVPERLGLFREGWLGRRAAVIVAAVPAPASLDELLASGEWQQFDTGDREAILDEIMAVTRRIHEAGLAWRGIGSRHFFPVRQADGRWRCWLIDCEGVHRRRGRRAIARDYDKLLRSLRLSGGDEEMVRSLEARMRSDIHLEDRMARMMGASGGGCGDVGMWR